ncbi:MAG TPA: XRE family transcriptional regulator [Gaiellaceae bacterium]|jgi:transcriptional regulator with XRE-family HTH domain|nr:XRE family transcriptional regulator [Gaiellaceae bacterium]
MSATKEPIDASVDLGNLLGRRLRDRRRELGLTLADLGAAAGISVGHASSIEKGASLPSLPVLARVAHALELTLADVLRASVSPRIVEGRIDDRPPVAQLSPEGARIRIVRARLRPGTSAAPPVDVGGEHDVFVFVHDGAVEIEVNDDERHELGPGDSIHCHSPRTIAWRAGAAGATAVWVAAGSP